MSAAEGRRKREDKRKKITHRNHSRGQRFGAERLLAGRIPQQRSMSRQSSFIRKNSSGAATGQLGPHESMALPAGKAPYRQEGRKIYQYLATVIAGSIMAQSGMNLGWTSPVLPKLCRNDSFVPQLGREPGGEDSSAAAWITSLMPLGAIAGAVPVGKAADLWGRKPSIGLTALPFLLCWLLALGVPFAAEGARVPLLLLARFLGGLGSGAACVLVPVYIGEVAEPRVRGTLGTFFPIFFSLGIVFSYAAGGYSSYLVFNGLCALLLLPFLAAVLLLLPESPSWLVQRGRKREALEVLRFLRGPGYDLQQEIAVLLEESEQLKVKEGGLHDLLCTRPGRKALATAVGLMLFQQLCGIDAVLFYTVEIFSKSKSSVPANIATIVVGLIELVMGLVVALTIDRFGRKPLLVFSGAAMTLCLGVLGYYYKLLELDDDDNEAVKHLAWLPLLCIGMFNVVFSLGYGSVPYSIISELFPPETKGIAGSISIMTNWFLVFLVTRTFHDLTQALGQSVTFWMFAAVCATSALFAYVFVPETKGKTLQEIQAKLGRSKKERARARLQASAASVP